MTYGKSKGEKIKVDGMLAATFFVTIFYSATYPFIHKQIISTAPSSIIALSQIINCLSVVTFGFIWNRNSDALFQFYPVYCVAETFLGIFSTIYAILTGNVIIYYLLDTIIFAVITRQIICGGVKLKALRYNSESARERFDNNNASIAAIATIIGSIIAMTIRLDFPMMLCVATFGNAIDNAFYICIYLKRGK